MKKLQILFLASALLLSCTEINQTENLLGQIEELQTENDSLKTIAEGINDKYVFDSVTIRSIPHYENTDKINSLYKTEFVFVAYNANGQSLVIVKDSIINDKGHKVLKLDTLRGKKGGFWLERILDSENNFFRGTLKTENEYGKSFEAPFATAIWVN